MKLINRASLAVQTCFMTIYHYRILINAGTVAALKLKPGDRINFMNDGKDWQLCITNDRDGFIVNKHGKRKKDGTYIILQIAHTGLCNMIIKSMGLTDGQPISVFDTKRESNGARVYELLK